MNHPHEEYGKQVLETYSSLQSAIDQAGGRFLTLEDLKTITMEDFILRIASNNVRFHFEKPKKGNK